LKFKRLRAIPNEKKFINFELGIEKNGSSEGENSFSDQMEIEQQQSSMATAFINQQSLVVKERDITYQVFIFSSPILSKFWALF
jgi:hypothetical protein